MRPYILSETNWENARKEKFELAILPWGATEAHNYHLPYATDNLEADFLANESARHAWEKGAKVIVLPTIPYGVNTGQTNVYLDMNLNPSTQLAILQDIAKTLDRQGISKLLIFNSHGGNDFKPLLRELGLTFPDMFFCLAEWFKMPEREIFFDEPGDHAEEVETSLMLYLRPDLVLPKEKWGKGEERKIKISSFSETWLWTERKWSKATADTGIGNPSKATADKGDKFFNSIARRLGDLFVEICQADLDDLYS
jgi:creatinine amidohydrolase